MVLEEAAWPCPCPCPWRESVCSLVEGALLCVVLWLVVAEAEVEVAEAEVTEAEVAELWVVSLWLSLWLRGLPAEREEVWLPVWL